MKAKINSKKVQDYRAKYDSQPYRAGPIELMR